MGTRALLNKFFHPRLRGALVWCCIITTALCVFMVNTAWGAPPVSTDITPSKGSRSTTFTQSISIEGTRQIGEPKVLSENDFTVRYIGPQQNVQILNGVVSALTTYRFKLKPKRSGTLTSPEYGIATDQGEVHIEPQTIEVTDAQDSGGDSDTELVSLNRYTGSPASDSVFVGQQIMDTVEIETAVALQNVQLSEDPPSGFVVELITPDEQDQSVRNGKTYTVARKRKVYFPLRSGTLEIPATTLTATAVIKKPFSVFNIPDPFSSDIFDNLLGENETIEKTASARSLTVQELPEAIRGTDFWGAPPLVGRTKLSLSIDPRVIDPGETKVLEVIIETEGNVKSLQNVPLPELPHAKVYPDPAQTSFQIHKGTLTYVKRFKYSIVPTSGGNIGVPSLTLWYFDPETRQYVSSKTDPVTIIVTGMAEPTPTPIPTQSIIQKQNTYNAPTQINEPSSSHFEWNWIFWVVIGGIAAGVFGLAASLSWKGSLLHRSSKKLHLLSTEKASSLKELSTIFQYNFEQLFGKPVTRQLLLEIPLPGELRRDIELFMDLCEEGIYGKKEFSSTQMDELKKRASTLIERLKVNFS